MCTHKTGFASLKSFLKKRYNYSKQPYVEYSRNHKYMMLPDHKSYACLPVNLTSIGLTFFPIDLKFWPTPWRPGFTFSG